MDDFLIMAQICLFQWKLLQIRLLNACREDCHILHFANWINIVTNKPFKGSTGNVINACIEVASLVKTDVSELRRPWFSSGHEKIGQLYLSLFH